MHKRENNGDGLVISASFHPPPSPSLDGRGSSKPSPLAGEGRGNSGNFPSLLVSAYGVASEAGAPGSLPQGRRMGLKER